MSAELTYLNHITDPLVVPGGAPLPNGEQPRWSPLSSTLILGEESVVVTDPPFTIAETDALAERIEATGLKLAYVFITHGHGDHWFGAARLIERFGGQVVAAPGTAAAIRLAGQNLGYWETSFPGQIPSVEVDVISPEAGVLDLEGHVLRIVEVGHGDTDDSAVLHVPDLSLVVAGDVIYDGYHQMLRESAGDGIDRWLAAVEKVQELNADLIVAGHKRKERDDDGPRQIRDTRDYLIGAKEVVAATASAQEFFGAIQTRFPERLNPNAAWLSALGLFA